MRVSLIILAFVSIWATTADAGVIILPLVPNAKMSQEYEDIERDLLSTTHRRENRRITAQDVDAANVKLEGLGYRAHWIPDTLMQLVQVVDHLDAPNRGHTHRGQNFDPAKKIVEWVKRAGYDLSDPRLDFSKLVDPLLDQIRNKDDLGLSKLLQGRDLFKAATQFEQKHKYQTVLWRFETDEPAKRLVQRPSCDDENRISYAYGLLSGYVCDGYMSSNIMHGLTNFSACTYCYWDVHQQGIAREVELRRTVTNPDYFHYLDNLKKHNVHAIVLNDRDTLALGNMLILPRENMHEQACLAQGENFHPLISLEKASEDQLAVARKVLENATPIYVNKTVLQQ